MSDEEIKADAPASAAPKKPRAKKAVPAEGAAKAATTKRTASSKAGTTAPKRKPAAAKPPAVAPAAVTALAVTPSPVAATSALDAATAKVNSMIPDNMSAKARDVAVEVKDKASDAVQGLARIISDSAGAIDDNVGPKYGDYARTAAQSVSDAADRLRAKPVDEIAEETREFVRAKPGTALGIAAVASLVLAKIFGSVFGKKR